MATGLSFHIGLNRVEFRHYLWAGILRACENDARDMQNLAKSQGFKSTMLLTKNATRENVINQINRAADDLKSGDIFLLTYSGHGGQIKDFNGDEIYDQQDETLCLYDGELIDDELNILWLKFAEGVRILFISDSCHSGTQFKGINLNDARINPISGIKKRFMPSDIANKTLKRNTIFYQNIFSKIPKTIEKPKASVIMISACLDNQLAADGDFNGAFTSRLLQVWEGGKFNGDYKDFHKKIKTVLQEQTPKYSFFGEVNHQFENQRPFSI